MTSTVRRRLAVAALLLLVPALAACGFGAQTDHVYQAANGPNNRDGSVDVLDALIVSDTDGTGTFAGTLVNKASTANQLVSITDADGPATVDLPPGQAVNLATSGQVRLKSDGIKPGAFVTLTLQFSSGQTTKIGVPVMTHEGIYADVPVEPTATPSETSTKHKKCKPSDETSDTTLCVTATATATPTE